MKKNVALMIILSSVLFLINCDPESNPSIWDAKDAGEDSPVITSVNPPSVQYGGIGDKGVVTIQGLNFNSSMDKNFVYFGKNLGTILESSTSELVVVPPAFYEDSLKIEVHVQGAYLPAVYGADNPTPFEIIPAVSTIGFYDKFNTPQGICTDNEGNLFISKGNVVDKITPDGTIIENLYEIKAKTTYNMLVGPDGALYYTFGKYFLKTDTTSGSHIYKNYKFTSNGLDFDSNHNLFVVGVNTIAKVDYTDLSFEIVKEFADTTFLACRVLEDELYLAGFYTGSDENISNNQFVCKVKLNSDGTFNGKFQPVRNWDGTEYEDLFITSLNFNIDGKMYLATSNYSLLTIEGDPSIGITSQVYPEILSEHVAFRVTWGIGEEIFINTYNETDDTKISMLKIMLFEKGAPYYGNY